MIKEIDSYVNPHTGLSCTVYLTSDGYYILENTGNDCDWWKLCSKDYDYKLAISEVYY